MDYQEVAAKISEALNTAQECSTAETVENYSRLGAQLDDLDTATKRSVQSHEGHQALVDKLERGTPLTEVELKTLRSLIVGDAEQYLKYGDNFERTKTELIKILDQVRELGSHDLDLETLTHLHVLCQEASSALAPTLHYLEQKDRVRKFEEHIRGPLSGDAGHVLARIIKEMAD